MTFVRHLSAQRQNEILGILLTAIALLLFISLFSYAPAEDYLLTSRNFGDPTRNLTGPVGQLLASALVLIFGYFSYFLPLILVLWGINRFLGTSVPVLVKRILCLTGMMIFLGALAGLIYPIMETPDGVAPATAIRTGGMVGSAVAFLLLHYFHVIGAYIVTITVLLMLVIAVTGIRLRGLVLGVGSILAGLFRDAGDAFRRAPQKRRRIRPATIRAVAREDHKLERKRKKAEKLRRKLETIQAEVETEEGHPPQIVKPREATPKEADKIKPTVLPSGAEYQLPPISLLHSPPTEDADQDEKELYANAEILESKLLDFGVEGKVVQVSPGPVITRYEVKPAPGVKVNRFVNLADDLALAMRAQRIRVVAPIPGKDAVGIEIPNRKPSVVYLQEILVSPQFQGSTSKLTLALGKTIAGEPYSTNLARMPHLLIAGATGSGKSVCIHSIIASILYRATPEEVRFILVDPKMLELTVFNNIPHLLTPVVIEPKEAVKVLRWAVAEMDRRYQILARAAVRNIDAYHAKRSHQAPPSSQGPAEEIESLPYIVIIVDELADLMLTVSNEIEDSIGRLAQMARAVGIHLVLATQRPSVDVITGVIKANFPTRIAFQVASKTDSRTILDMNGAEKLLGRGDMLFLPPGRPEALRLHGAFVSAEETERIASFLAAQGVATEKVADLEEQVTAATVAAEKDDLFDEAMRLVIRHQQGSVSLLQRRLKIGYARAGRLMDQLEAAGVVGPFDGSRAREVLVDPDYLDEMDTRNMASP